MAKQKSMLINCSCGCNKFKIVDEKIVCAECGREVRNEKAFFIKNTDNKFFLKLIGIAIGTAAVAAGYCIEVSISPFAFPIAIKSLGYVAGEVGSLLGDLVSDKIYSSGTYGEQLAKKFDSVFEKIYKTDKKDTNGIHQSFRNYSDYCRRHYTEVLSLLFEKDLSADVFSEEAIEVIISKENHYPGADNPQILDNVLSVSGELEREYKQAILNDKDLCFRWLIEKRTGTLEEKIDKIIEYLTHPVEKIKLTDAEFEYIRSYNRPLFLEDDSDISLNSVYVDPIVEDNGNNITDEIYNWYEYDNKKILIIKGAAGIGKTSLVSRIIADTYGHSDFKNNLEREDVFPIILRSNIEAFENASSNKTPIAIIKDILDVRSEDIQKSLIILDGFDELALLSKGFDCKKFLKHLVGDLDNLETTKVLITSRPMDEINVDIENVKIKSIVWKKEQILSWCEKFRNASEKDSEKQWCDSFIANYDDLAQNDSDGNKMDIFKAPMILYLACHSDSRISANETVGEFYDRVFRAIASREHLKKHIAPNVLKDKSEKENIINWQFTKELAYQMFLHDTLILSDSELIKNAENRTAEVLVKRGIIANKNDLEIDKLKYLAVTHFAKETTNEKGIEFAHKTVYEYFAAVKLYEDYFAEITEDYPENFKKKDALGNEITPLENVWTNIIEAFRYASIDKNIFTYLNKMKLPVYNGKAKDKGKCFDFNTFVKYFVEGMERQILSDLPINRPVMAYKVAIHYLDEFGIGERYNLVPTQISCAFCNLTWFLTGYGYCNEENNDKCKRFGELVSIYCGNLNLKNWKLSGAYLENVDLGFANLIETDLSEAKLRGAYLSFADLSRAKLIGAKLIGAKLIGADLSGADMSEANLYGADLSGADLNGANLRKADLFKCTLRGAKYCLDKEYKTIFPAGFNPEEHGMIEVDIDGNPVKKSETENNVEE